MTEQTHHELTAQEFFESLNGFDELAIAKAFGAKPVELNETDHMAFGRSLVFVAHRREGLSDAEAKKAAMDATIGQVNTFFRPDDDEPMPEDPVTPAGKDERSPSPSPTISPGSAS
jgi:hypothetical protein